MAFRGRGRGRGRGGYGGYPGAPEPFILFPEDVQLPDITGVTEEKALIYWNMKLQNYWKSSPYYLEAAAKKNEDIDIERYSDRNKPNKAKRPPLSYHLKLTPAYFPVELIEGAKRVQIDQKKVRWDPESSLQKFDLFEKLEQKDQDGKREKEKKEGENEDDDEERIEEEDAEFSDDGDYNQNIDFDDDEDDFNIDDGPNDDDEAIY